MINNLYTTFEQLVHAEDADLASLFEALRSKKNRHSSHSDSQCMQMITMRSSFTKQDAHDKMVEILEILHNCGNDFYSCYAKLAGILTPEGMAHLMKLLLNKTIEQDEELIAKFTSPADILDSFFKGMPLFRVVVEDMVEDNEECLKSEGRYIVYLENCVTNVRDKVTFKNKDSKVLYLWFLMHPHEYFARSGLRGIISHNQELLRIVRQCYENHSCDAYIDNMAEKFTVMDKDKLDETMADFMKVAKKDANYVVKDALANKDIEDWYIIEIGKDGKSGANKYAISLTPGFINLPQSLRNI